MRWLLVLALVAAHAVTLGSAFSPPSHFSFVASRPSSSCRAPNLRAGAASRLSMSSRWANPNWRWGYGIGLAHDEAAKLRAKLRSSEQRSLWLDEMVSPSGGVDWEEVKLALALKWQRDRERGDDAIAAYNQVMEQLRLAKYEGEEEDQLFVKDMEARLRFFGEYSQGLVLDFRGKQAAESPEAADSKDGRRRVIAAAVLEGFDFVDLGL